MPSPQHEVFNSFKFYHPKTVWLICVFASLMMFYDQGTTFSNVSMVREDPVINAIEDKPSPMHHSSTNNSNGTTASTTTQAALSTTASGIFSSIFMVGFVIGVPVSATCLGKFGSNTLLKFGTIGWTFTVVAVACAPEYYSLVTFRFFIGFFEAFFSPFLTTVIDNIATPEKKMMWLATFFSMMPVCTAAGMFLSSLISSNFKIEAGSSLTIPGWRLAYLLEVPFAIALSALVWGIPEAYNIFKPLDQEEEKQEEDKQENDDSIENNNNNQKERDEDSSPYYHQHDDDQQNAVNVSEARIALKNETAADHDEKTNNVSQSHDHKETFISFGPALSELLCNNLDYALIALGYAAFDFLVTSFGSWCTVMLIQGPYGASLPEASAAVGVPMCFLGLVGTILGGVAIDKLGGVESQNGLSKCVLFPLSACAVGFVFGALACLTDNIRDFVILFSFSVVFITMNTAGIGIAVLKVCKSQTRPYASSILLFTMNLFGDAPAPFVNGFLAREFFSGNCNEAGTEAHCNFMRDLQRNETARATAANELNYIERTWWWQGECKWNVASLKGQESYCANTSQINRACICSVFICFILVPMWATVGYRRWGTKLDSMSEKKEERNDSDEKDGIVVDEKTKLLE